MVKFFKLGKKKVEEVSKKVLFDYEKEDIDKAFNDLESVVYNLTFNPRGVSEFSRGITEDYGFIDIKPKKHRSYFLLSENFQDVKVYIEKETISPEAIAYDTEAVSDGFVLSVEPKEETEEEFVEVVEDTKIYLKESKELLTTAEKAINFVYTFGDKTRIYYFIVEDYSDEFKENYLVKDTDLLNDFMSNKK